MAVALLPIICLALAGSAVGLPLTQQPLKSEVLVKAPRPTADIAEATRTVEKDDPELKEALTSLRESRSCSTLTQVGSGTSSST